MTPTPDLPAPKIHDRLTADLLGRVVEQVRMVGVSILLSCSGEFHAMFVPSLDIQLPAGAHNPPTINDVARSIQRLNVFVQTHTGALPPEILALPSTACLTGESAAIIGQTITAVMPAVGEPGIILDIGLEYQMHVKPSGAFVYRRPTPLQPQA